MLGISWTEFVVIILISICMIPVKYWPDVFSFLGKCVKWVRNMIWKISDVSEQVKERLDLEKPINDLIANATEDILKKQSKKVLKTTRIKK